MQRIPWRSADGPSGVESLIGSVASAAQRVGFSGRTQSVDELLDDRRVGFEELRERGCAERVYYAGLPEHEEEAIRRERGIPYHPEVIEWFKGVIAELEIEDRLPEV